MSRAVRTAASLALFFLAACTAGPKTAPAPMPSLALGTAPPECKRAVIFLPGRRDTAADFDRKGFALAARRAGWDAEFIAADARMAYYEGRSLLPRLREDILLPARARGRSEIWIVGISIGGMGALLYAREHPEDLAGIVLLAPYLGDARLVEEIRASGGLARWEPGPTGKDIFRDLWGWLRERPQGPARELPIYLGYGSGDRYGGGHRLLAETLPPERVEVLPGGHDWNTWSRLWERLLKRLPPAR